MKIKNKKALAEALRQVVKVISENFDSGSLEMDEDMARTAGTGGAIKLTDEGRAFLKAVSVGNKATIDSFPGITKKDVQVLALLFKIAKTKDRVQKIDIAREMGVEQPYVNGTFKKLMEEPYNFVALDKYEPGTNASPKAAGGGSRDFSGLLGGDDFADL